ncbi:MAG: hypothetical protein V2I33_24980, partial [Kangiellaceae bacterium]|nr:hypothetical protein [Kangiellaceae bacterium]
MYDASGSEELLKVTVGSGGSVTLSVVVVNPDDQTDVSVSLASTTPLGPNTWTLLAYTWSYAAGTKLTTLNYYINNGAADATDDTNATGYLVDGSGYLGFIGKEQNSNNAS